MGSFPIISTRARSGREKRIVTISPGSEAWPTLAALRAAMPQRLAIANWLD